MSEFGIKGSIPDKDFMIHVLNNLPEEYDATFDGFMNCLTLTGPDALMIEVIHDTLNHQ